MKYLQRIKNISGKLNEAKLRKLKAFGWDSHNWKINNPIKIDYLEELENKYNVTMPSEYRGFILSFGDGGAGAAYGLFSIKNAIGCYRNPPKVDILSKAFPHTEYYNADDPFWIDIVIYNNMATLKLQRDYHLMFITN